MFNSLVQFKSSDDLVKDDVCIVFREIEDIDNESYVEIYRVDKISNRPNETYEPLNNNLLGGFKISTTSESAMALEKKEDRVKVVSSLNETGNTGIWLIKNANGTINTMKIEGVTTLFVSQSEKNFWNNKVDKVSGKQLSTNDYTNVDKAKVDNIPSNPKYSDTLYDDSQIINRIVNVENRVDKDTTYEIANRQTDGLMPKTHFVKLAEIETGAQVNTINSVNNKTGNVVLTKEDIGLGAVNNVAITQEQVTKINELNKEDIGLGAVNNVAITQEQVTKINELNYTRAMTQAQYDALSTTEKNRTDVWYGIY